MLQFVRCTCCQAELTAPQYHNGHAYGYVCIRKFDANHEKSDTKYVKLTVIKQSSDSIGTNRKHLLVTDGEHKAWLLVYMTDTNAQKFEYMENGEALIPDTLVVSLGKAKSKSNNATTLESKGFDLSPIWKLRD